MRSAPAPTVYLAPTHFLLCPDNRTGLESNDRILLICQYDSSSPTSVTLVNLVWRGLFLLVNISQVSVSTVSPVSVSNRSVSFLLQFLHFK